jgi:hypothetical protein
MEIVFPLMKCSDFGTMQVTDPWYCETELHNFVIFMALKRTYFSCNTRKLNLVSGCWEWSFCEALQSGSVSARIKALQRF